MAGQQGAQQRQPTNSNPPKPGGNEPISFKEARANHYICLTIKQGTHQRLDLPWWMLSVCVKTDNDFIAASLSVHEASLFRPPYTKVEGQFEETRSTNPSSLTCRITGPIIDNQYVVLWVPFS
jgi:hypothetical protein